MIEVCTISNKNIKNIKNLYLIHELPISKHSVLHGVSIFYTLCTRFNHVVRPHYHNIHKNVLQMLAVRLLHINVKYHQNYLF